MSAQDPANALQTFSYDAVGNRTAATDQLNRTTTYTFDSLNRNTSVKDPHGSITSYSYDKVGNRTTLTDPLNQTTSFFFDKLNRLTQQTDPLSHSDLFAYDAVGNRTQATDRDGRVRAFNYDNLNRQTKETWLNGATVVRTINFAYDAVGNLLSAFDSDSFYTFTYDVLNRQTSVDNAGSVSLPPHVVLSYSYDAVGNTLSVADNQLVTVGSTYTPLNQLASRTWTGTVAPVQVIESYDVAGQRTEIDRYTNTVGTGRVGRSLFSFDQVGNLTDISHRDASDAFFAQYLCPAKF